MHIRSSISILLLSFSVFTSISARDFGYESIVIDPGHGGSDIGAPGYNGGKKPNEADIVLDISLKLKEKLGKNNTQVFMTRSTSGSITGGGGARELAARVRYINQKNPKALISIHMNGSTNSGASGVETYYHSQGSRADKKLAEIVQKHLLSKTGKRNRGVKQKQLAILGVKASISAILAEAVFISNVHDYNFIIQSRNKIKVSDAFYDSLYEFLGRSKYNAYIRKFYKRYFWYFGNKKGGNFTCYTQYTCQKFTNGKMIAVRNHDNYLFYWNSSNWYRYGYIRLVNGS